jgi:hypothetical protein
MATIVFHSNKFKALIYLNEKLILSTFALPAFDNMHKLANIMRVLIPDTFRNLFWNSVWQLKLASLYALVAQLVEQVTLNHLVAGSSPAKRTTP